MSERMDYVAFKNGNAYALMSADHADADDIREFHQENPDAEIKLMPTSEAVELHLRYVESRAVHSR